MCPEGDSSLQLHNHSTTSWPSAQSCMNAYYYTACIHLMYSCTFMYTQVMHALFGATLYTPYHVTAEQGGQQQMQFLQAHPNTMIKKISLFLGREFFRLICCRRSPRSLRVVFSTGSDRCPLLQLAGPLPHGCQCYGSSECHKTHSCHENGAFSPKYTQTT